MIPMTSLSRSAPVFTPVTLNVRSNNRKHRNINKMIETNRSHQLSPIIIVRNESRTNSPDEVIVRERYITAKRRK